MIHFQVALGAPLNFQVPGFDLQIHLSDGTPTKGDLKPNSPNFPQFQALRTDLQPQFFIFESVQIKALHLVKFKGGKALSRTIETLDKCELCGGEVATLYCFNDMAQFCDNCDELTHRSTDNYILDRHKRISIEEAKAIKEVCKEHPDTRCEQYCAECKIPICYKCKMYGTHSKGKKALHGLVNIADAYSQAIAEAEQQSPILKEKSHTIKSKLEDLEERLKSIEKNEQNIELEINKIRDAAIERAQKLAAEKALIVNSRKLELLRKTSGIQNGFENIDCSERK